MELDSKQKVLLAIYAEYQKDLPEVWNVTHNALGLESNIFKMAVKKLDNEGLITEAIISSADGSAIPIHVNLRYCMMTNYGIAYVEQKMQLDKTMSGEQKVKGIMEKTAKWGWEQFKDIGAKIIAEMIKSSMENPK